MISTDFFALFVCRHGLPYILQKDTLSHSSPEAVCQDPQELCGGRGGRQWAAGKTAQEDGVFAPGIAGKAVDALDDLKRIGIVLVCHFGI